MLTTLKLDWQQPYMKEAPGSRKYRKNKPAGSGVCRTQQQYDGIGSKSKETIISVGCCGCWLSAASSTPGQGRAVAMASCSQADTLLLLYLGLLCSGYKPWHFWGTEQTTVARWCAGGWPRCYSAGITILNFLHSSVYSNTTKYIVMSIFQNGAYKIWEHLTFNYLKGKGHNPLDENKHNMRYLFLLLTVYLTAKKQFEAIQL